MSYRNYIEHGTLSGSKIPAAYWYSSIGNETYGLYFQDSVYVKKLYKTNDNGTTLPEVVESARTIRHMWHDKANDKLYVIGTDFITTKLYITTFYIDMRNSDNKVSMEDFDVLYDRRGARIFMIGSDIYIIYSLLTDGQKVRVEKWGGDAWSVEDTAAVRAPDSGVAIVGTDVYYIAFAAHIYVYKFDSIASSLTLLVDEASGHGYEPSYLSRSLIYDEDDSIYFIATNSSGSAYYLWKYSITGNSLTEMGIYKVGIQSLNNTSPGALEKWFYLDQPAVYQMRSDFSALYNIANPNLSGSIRGLSDNYLITDAAQLWEYVECGGSIKEGHILTQERSIPLCQLLVTGVEIDYSQYVKIEDIFTSSGATATGVLFEGYVDAFDGKTKNRVDLKSIYAEDFEVSPTGAYSGTIDVIASGLIRDWTKRINCNSNTLSAGTYGLTGQFSGNMNLPNILNDLVEIEKFTWYLQNDDGYLYIGNYPIDSKITFSGNQKVSATDKRQDKHKNKIHYWGGTSDGDNLYSTTGDILNQELYGVMPKTEDNPIIRDQGVLDSGAKNLLDVFLDPPLKYRLYDGCRPTGMVQVGEKFVMGDHIKLRGYKGYATTGTYYFNASDYNMKSRTSELWVSSGVYYG